MLSDDKMCRELLSLWQVLETDDRADLLDHARWLAYDNRLKGGPFDGLKVPERFKDEPSISIEVGDRAAVYQRSGLVLHFCFSGLRRIGGEGGEWPDIKAEELREMGVEQ